MAYYRITYTFTANPPDESSLTISDDSGLIVDMTYKDVITDIGDIVLSSPFQATIGNTYSTFNITYNGTGTYNHGVGNNTWWVEKNWDGIPTYTEPSGGVTSSIEAVTPPLSILSVEYEQSTTDACLYVNAKVTGSREFTITNSPTSNTFPASTTYTFTDLQRASVVTFEIEDDEGFNGSTTETLPPFLSADDITIEVYGGTVLINNSVLSLTLEYSLDGIAWQTQNSFVGLLAGDYTVYVRDQYKCVVTKAFTIIQGEDGSIIIPDPFFFYPEANPIRVKYNQAWDDCGILKNDRNTLSCEGLDRVSYGERQTWRSCDNIYIQVKSNYNDLAITTTDDGLEVNLEQKSNFIGRKEAMDCKIIKLTDGTNGIYFLSGDTYDYDTLTNLNTPYILNGELPSWGVQGQIVTIGGSNYTVTDVSFNEDLQVNQLVIVGVLPEADYIVKAIYNIFGYEVYEGVIDCTGRDSFQVELFYDGAIQGISELQVIDDSVSPLLKVTYFMDYNTDMFWATGIQPDIRIHVDTSQLVVDRTIEEFKTDSTAYQIDVSNYRKNAYKLFPVTKELARKLITIFSSSNININGIDYICTEVSNESQGGSNLNVLTATMTEKGTGLAQQRSADAQVSLSALINQGTGYIKL